MASSNIPDWPKARDRILATIPNLGNRAKLLEYLNEREANGLKSSSLGNEANAMRDFCLHLGDRALDSTRRADIAAFVNAKARHRIWRATTRDGNDIITRREVPLQASTLSTRKVILKAFFKWMRGTEEYPDEVRWLRTSRPAPDMIPTDELVTKDDLAALIGASPERRDRALLAVLYDTGFRAGEICALNIGSVMFVPERKAVRITLPKGTPGLKTGARTVMVWECVPFLLDWLNHHPHRADPERALFYSNSRRAPMRRMTNSALHGFLQNAAKRAGLRKHLNPHRFRHSAATERVRLGWTEAHMRPFFGWRRSSAMPSHYVHLAGSDYEKIEMNRRGMLDGQEVPTPALTGLMCGACQEPNLLTAAFCGKCARPVSPTAVAEHEERQRAGVREELARLMAVEMREQLAREVRKALETPAQTT